MRLVQFNQTEGPVVEKMVKKSSFKQPGKW